MTRLSLHLACRPHTRGPAPHTPEGYRSPEPLGLPPPRSPSGARSIPAPPSAGPAGWADPAPQPFGGARSGIVPRNRAQVLRELPGTRGAAVLLRTHLRPPPPAAPLPDGLLPPDKEQRAEGSGPPRPPYTAGSAPAGAARPVRMRQCQKSRQAP